MKASRKKRRAASQRERNEREYSAHAQRVVAQHWFGEWLQCNTPPCEVDGCDCPAFVSLHSVDWEAGTARWKGQRRCLKHQRSVLMDAMKSQSETP